MCAYILSQLWDAGMSVWLVSVPEIVGTDATWG